MLALVHIRWERTGRVHMDTEGGEQESPEDGEDSLGWWTISGIDLLALLRRCHAGEDPDVVYMEEYANADVEYPGNDESSDGGTSANPDN